MRQITGNTRHASSVIQHELEQLPIASVVATVAATALIVTAAMIVGLILGTPPDSIISVPIRV